MTNGEAINWIINISADIGKAEHRDLWHYEQALSEIKEMLETSQPEPCGDAVSRTDVFNAVRGEERGGYVDETVECMLKVMSDLPSVTPEWNNHTVACLLAELFDDTCACNYNGIDEWLPEKCEVIDSCPNPVGVACWEQYLKHRAERRKE